MNLAKAGEERFLDLLALKELMTEAYESSRIVSPKSAIILSLNLS